MINIRNAYLLNVRFHRYNNNNLLLYYNHESQISNYFKFTAYNKRFFLEKRDFLVTFIDHIVIIQLIDREIPFYSHPTNITSIDFCYTWPKRRGGGVERLGDWPIQKEGGSRQWYNTHILDIYICISLML